jgi:hypothetical protein
MQCTDIFPGKYKSYSKLQVASGAKFKDTLYFGMEGVVKEGEPKDVSTNQGPGKCGAVCVGVNLID